MAKKQSLKYKSADKYQKYLYKSYKKPLVIAGVSVGIAALAVGIVGIQMSNKNKLESAKTYVKNFDSINREIKIDDSPENDNDNDGLTNGEEENLATNFLCIDSDGDGLSDGDEIKIDSDPLVADTDGDGILDGIEVMAGLDPTSAQTNGTDDVSRDFTVSISEGEVSAQIKGTAQMYGTVLSNISLIGFSANSSIVSQAYEIYNTTDFESCTLTFKVDDDIISSKELSVFRFDASEGEFEKISSKTDKNANTVSAEISEYGAYMVGEVSSIGEEALTRIHFLIDNSGSLYPDEMVPDSPENDTDFKRLEFAEELIEQFDDTYTVAISKFTKDYTCLQDFTSDKNKLYDALDTIEHGDEKFNGTYIQTSLEKCIETFKDTNKKTVNIIIMITDGNTNESTKPDASYIAKLAKEKNIIIITVSIGSNIDKSILSEIAQQSGGKYYSASDADSLSEIHNQIVTSLNYDKVDISSDSSGGKIGYMLYDTGFVPSNDGFGFTNFRTTDSDSTAFGLALFAKEWFAKTLPVSLNGIEFKEKTEYNYDAEGYDLSGTEFESGLSDGDDLRSFSFIAVTTKRFTDCLSYIDFSGSRGAFLDIEADIKTEAIKKGWAYKTYNMDNDDLKWSRVYLLSLNISGKYDSIESTYGTDEAMFYKAINRLNAEQWNEKNNFYSLSDGDEGFNKLCNDLSQGIPSVIMLDGTHAVNALSLIRNAENPTEYILKIYDTNTVDVTKEIVIKKTVGCTLTENGTVKSSKNYYTATLDGESVLLTYCDINL